MVVLDAELFKVAEEKIVYASKWVYSKAGEVGSHKRSRLQPKIVETILFLNTNL